jgi:hypothetical protein
MDATRISLLIRSTPGTFALSPFRSLWLSTWLMYFRLIPLFVPFASHAYLGYFATTMACSE